MNKNFRPICRIAEEIRADWKNVNFAAKPYLAAMNDLYNVTDKYMYDDAKGIILYFLANARTWKGDTAKRIKNELKEMIK